MDEVLVCVLTWMDHPQTSAGPSLQNGTSYNAGGVSQSQDSASDGVDGRKKNEEVVVVGER